MDQPGCSVQAAVFHHVDPVAALVATERSHGAALECVDSRDDQQNGGGYLYAEAVGGREWADVVDGHRCAAEAVVDGYRCAAEPVGGRSRTGAAHAVAANVLLVQTSDGRSHSVGLLHAMGSAAVGAGRSNDVRELESEAAGHGRRDGTREQASGSADHDRRDGTWDQESTAVDHGHPGGIRERESETMHHYRRDGTLGQESAAVHHGHRDGTWDRESDAESNDPHYAS